MCEQVCGRSKVYHEYLSLSLNTFNSGGIVLTQSSQLQTAWLVFGLRLRALGLQAATTPASVFVGFLGFQASALSAEPSP